MKLFDSLKNNIKGDKEQSKKENNISPKIEAALKDYLKKEEKEEKEKKKYDGIG